VRARIPALLMALLLVLYLVFVFQYAIVLMTIDELPAKIMGVALIVLPILGAWALAVELRFGFRAEALAKKLEAEGGMPTTVIPRGGGRPVPDVPGRGRGVAGVVARMVPPCTRIRRERRS
jgi:hypothetical protein